jgi:hypothetical protein
LREAINIIQQQRSGDALFEELTAHTEIQLIFDIWTVHTASWEGTLDFQEYKKKVPWSGFTKEDFSVLQQSKHHGNSLVNVFIASLNDVCNSCTLALLAAAMLPEPILGEVRAISYLEWRDATLWPYQCRWGGYNGEVAELSSGAAN